jgi:hypothetical protein
VKENYRKKDRIREKKKDNYTNAKKERGTKEEGRIQKGS